VWQVNDDDIEDENDNKYFILEFESRQDDRDTDLDYQMRVTVQLTDKKTKEVVYAQTMYKPHPIPGNDKYADHTAWKYQIPFDFLIRPKLTAYVIEFGFMQDSYFVPVAVECDDAETPEEIIEAGGKEVKMECIYCSHYHWNN